MQKKIMIVNEKFKKENDVTIYTFPVKQFMKSPPYCNVPVTGFINGQGEARAKMTILNGIIAIPAVLIQVLIRLINR